MTPRVSIAIPAYNAAAFLERTLECVAAQTFKDFDVVVVDDGSTDGTAEAAERALARLGLRGRCLRQPNKKIAAARNAAARAGHGELISFLDADDRWLPGKLAAATAEFDAHPGTDAVCHAERILQEGREIEIRRYGPLKPDMYAYQLWGGCALSTSATTLRREVFERAGGFRERPEFNTVEDYDLWMRLARDGCRFRFMDAVLGEYVIEEHNSTRRVEHHRASLESLLRDHFKDLYGHEPGLAARLRMRRRIAAVYRMALGLLMRYRESPELQREYALKMLREFPLDPKNVVRALQWVAGISRGC